MSHHNPFISFPASEAESCNTVANTKSLMYDGVNDYVTILDTAKDFQFTEAEFSGGLTFNCWVKFDAFAGTEPLFCIGRANNKYYGYAFQISAVGKPQMHKYGANNGAFGQSSNNRRTLQMASAISTGTWYMITYIMGSGNADDWKIMINGVKQTTSKSGNANVTLTYNNTTAAYIGRQGRSGSEKYHAGNISSCATWFTELSETEVLSLYNTGIVADLTENCSYGGNSTASTNLEMWLKTEAGSGTTLTDSSGNGHGGAITGSTWETDIPN